MGKAVDPPLRVREDWWVFEDLLRLREDWWVFEDALRFKEALVVFQRFKKVLVGFQKTSLNAKEVFRKPFLSPIS